MTRITSSTTLGDLALLRAQYGINKLEVRIAPEDKKSVITYAHTDKFIAIGTGKTEYESLDDAFARVFHRNAADLLT